MELTSGLNPAQNQAVTAGLGPVLVLAGPGSGKTRVLTHRIAYLVKALNIAPWNIMAVTFTNKAAREMRERVEALLDGNLKGLMVGTFHSTCVRILRRETAHLEQFGYVPNFVIFDSDDQKQVIKAVLKELDIDDKKFKPANLINNISNAKDSLIMPEMYVSTDYAGEVTKRVYEQYQNTLIANNAMDFDDLLLNVVRLFDAAPDVLAKYQEQYRHLLVDEFQDTNTVQYALITRLAATNQNVFVVGDSDQSIYKWRGADFRNIERFRDQFPQVVQVLLEQNYRSTQVILDAAKAVIKRNSDRVHKDLFTDRSGGEQIVLREAYNEVEEADWVVNSIAGHVREGGEPGDCAVMYRTNAQSRVIEEAFLRAALPYRLVGATRFYGRREVKDILAYVRLVHNLQDEISFRRVISTPPRGIGAKTAQVLLDWGREYGLQAGEAVLLLATDPTVQHPFKGRALTALTRFGNLLNGWYMSRDHVAVGDLMDKIIQQIGFRDHLDDGTDEGKDRWANVLELKGVADSAPEAKLADFLEQVALVSDVDSLEGEVNAPTLLTLHASKGLEFPVVFLTGLEDGLLPHSRALAEAEEMAEERRLFYVGLTRAENQVYLSYAFRRTLYGMSDMTIPSRFLSTIPGELIEGGNPQAQREAAQDRASDWQWGQKQQRKQTGSRAVAGQYGSHRSNRPKLKSTRKPAPRSQSTARSSKLGPAKRDLPKPNLEQERERPAGNVVLKHKTGQEVRHAKFGEGIVLSSKVTGSDEEVTVAFKREGIKRLAASFANLEVTKEPK